MFWMETLFLESQTYFTFLNLKFAGRFPAKFKITVLKDRLEILKSE